ncbi:MAG: glycosyltransferase [Acetobacteraceae bacterium]|nr:glycosyltransferase [Acetobacteraceae bacterium]
MPCAPASQAPATGVVILLACYQGGRYLREQLASIAGQEHRDWRLVWRDDGSDDDTVAILHDFAAAQPPGRVTCFAGPAGRIGSAASFLALLRHAAPTLGAHDIAAFADQDDVWLPLKLGRAVAALRGAAAAAPAIYTARQVLVDARLDPLAISPALVPPTGFPASLTQNLATGNTVALNPAAARLVAGSAAPPGCQHDWWAYLLVTAAGGTLIADDEPVVLYRQHSANAVGAARSLLQRAAAAVWRGPGVFMGLVRQNLAALDAQRHLLTPQACRDLDAIIAALQGSPRQRLRALRLPGLRRQTWAEQVLFRLWFMLG